MHEMSHPGELPLQQIDAKVSGLQQLQDDVMHLQLRLPRSQVMDFLAGQRAQLCLEDGSCLELGIASCPCDSHSLSFHVRRQPDDAFSNRVFEHLQKGKKVALSGPVGRFTLDEASSRPLIFIAWESGFAQIKSIIDHVVSIDPERQMFLHWLSALPQGHYLSNYCRSWRDALDNFNYQCVDLQPLGEATFVSTLQGIAAQHENLEEFDIYAVLPEYEADIMLSFMVENEVMESRLFTEILKQS
jgi:CDP-4-dehydro-6-deoxyglucose reductase